MLTVMAALAGAFLSPSSPADPVCEVGRVVLHDTWPARTPDPSGKRETTNFIDVVHGLFAACPALRAEVPAGYTIADDDARARASIHVPTPGQQVVPAFIHMIDVPHVAPDGRSATVEIKYDCTGLCGGGATWRYLRTGNGWRRDGAPQGQWVS